MKKMKKLSILLVAALFAVVSFSACSDDDNLPSVTKIDEVVGEWQVKVRGVSHVYYENGQLKTEYGSFKVQKYPEDTGLSCYWTITPNRYSEILVDKAGVSHPTDSGNLVMDKDGQMALYFDGKPMPFVIQGDPKTRITLLYNGADKNFNYKADMVRVK